jgi:hypothetical protein
MELVQNNEEVYKQEVEDREMQVDMSHYHYDHIALPLQEDEVKVQILHTTMLNYMNTNANAEVRDMAKAGIEALQRANEDVPLSSKFINSIFNFHNVYRPLYDLLDVVTNGTHQGRKMSDEYRNGVIDAIVALRRYERNHGLGDAEWEIEYNTAINRVIE